MLEGTSHPVLQSTGEYNSDFHDVEDGSSEVRYKLDELVLRGTARG